MKTHFGHHLPVGTKFKVPLSHLPDLFQNAEGVTVVPSFKYTLDLFYLAPFYHLEFPTWLHRLLVLDIDLEVGMGPRYRPRGRYGSSI